MWRACGAVVTHVVGHAWRRVTTLCVLLLGGGVLVVVVADGVIWQEVGTAFIGGSVVGLVLTIAQHTLDQQAIKRQADNEILVAVSASSDLQGIGLRGASLSKAYLRRKDLASANLDEAQLDSADLRDSNLTGASLRYADLRRADLRGAKLAGAVLDGADLNAAHLDASQMQDARLVGADLRGAEITTVQALDSSTSDRVDLSRARLDKATLRDVRLVGLRASFASARGMDATAADLRSGDFSCADLRGAGLSRANLRGCDFGGSDLSGAVLAGVDLTGARLVGARMAHTDLTGAILDDADLRCADLRGAFLTNVDLGSANLKGAWVAPGDLRRATSSPDPGQIGAVVVDTELAPSRESEGASLAGSQAAGRFLHRRKRTSLRVVAESRDLRPTARRVAKQLQDRRRSLERINRDIESIVVSDGPPHAGDPTELGLPDRVKARRWLGRRGPRAELRPHTEGVEVVLRGIPGATQVGVVTGTWGQGIASALQLALAGQGPFLSWKEIDTFSTWLERPGDVAPVQALEQVLVLNSRNAIALLLRAWLREVGDAEAAARTLDEVRIVWSASRPGARRALAAARLGNVQCQLVHRTSVTDATGLIARAQAAGDASLALFDSLDRGRAHLPGGRRRRRRWVALRSKARHAQALASHIRTGDRPQPDHDELDEGIRRYRKTVREFEAAGLPVSPTIRNNLAYCLMARVGRFMTGPGQGYSEAVTQLRLVLQQFGVYEQHCNADASGACTTCGRPLRQQFGVDQQHCIGAVAKRQGAVSVQEMARLSDAGEESGPETHLRRRREVRLALANLGNLYRLFKQFDAAITCYSAALYCEPRYIEAYGERAWVRLEQGDADGATQDLQRALDVPFGTDPQKARIVLYYVDALGRVGRTRDQGPWIERALQLDPGSHQAKELAAAWEANTVEDAG